jgi:hypothetical protein
MYQLAQDIADQPFPQTPPAGFNEAAYLAANPDVADAVRRGEVRSGFEHYRRFGFSENRPGVGFNEADYLASNPDVAEAVRRGEISSGLEHYRLYGQVEGRQGGGRKGERWTICRWPLSRVPPGIMPLVRMEFTLSSHVPW